MRRTSISEKLLISFIGEELPQLSQRKQREIAEILSRYILLLNKGRIEEAEKLVLDNHKQLVKIL